MKKYIKEIIILLLQLLTFYILPLFMGPNDAIVMVLLIIVTTFTLSIILGSFSKDKIKYLYPFLISILFIPSVCIYYNSSALVHSLWYFVISFIGLGIGSLINKKEKGNNHEKL